LNSYSHTFFSGSGSEKNRCRLRRQKLENSLMNWATQNTANVNGAQKKLTDLEIKSMRDCLRAANTSDDPEIRKRAGEIVGKYYGVRSDDKKTPMPSIYMLPDKNPLPAWCEN
jgi:hypothetical protein